MAQVIQKRPQQVHGRVNSDTLLQVSPGKEIRVNNPNINLPPGGPASYTVTMVVESAGVWSVSKGAWQASYSDYNVGNLKHLAFTATGMFANGEPVGSHAKVPNNTDDLVISGDVRITHLKIANRNWTSEEIREDSRQPGSAPSSTHASILAHYVADRQGRTMWDAVEQYNYAKMPNTQFSGTGTFATSWDSFLIKSVGAKAELFLESDGRRYNYATFGFSDRSVGVTAGINYDQIKYSVSINSSTQTVRIFNYATEVLNTGISTIGAHKYRLLKLTDGNIYLFQDEVLIYTFQGVTGANHLWFTLLGLTNSHSNLALDRRILDNPDSIGNIQVVGNNSIKTLPLTAQHANLINYTDSEVGLPNESSQTAYKDFYSKQNYYPYCFYYGTEAANRYRFRSINNLGSNSTGILPSDSSFTVLFEGMYVQNTLSFTFSGDGHVIFAASNLKLSQMTANSFRFFFAAGSDNQLNLNLNESIFDHPGRPFLILCTYNKTSKQLTVRFKYLNSNQVTVAAKVFPSGWSRINNPEVTFARARLAHRRLFIHDQEIDNQAVNNVLNNHDFSALSAAFVNVNFSESSGVNLKNLSPFSDFRLWKDFSDVYVTGNPNFWFEKSSLLPALQNALRFNGDTQYALLANFIPSKEAGYTINTVFAMNSNTVFAKYAGFWGKRQNSSGMWILVGKQGTKQIEMWNNGSAYVVHTLDDATALTMITIVVNPSITNSHNVDFYLNGHYLKSAVRTITGFDGITGNLNIAMENGHELDGKLIQNAFAKGIATPRQVKELYNNTLLRQPLKSWSNLDWQLLPNFNKLIDNTANVPGQYLLEDLSGKGHTIEAVGYTAANLNPADPAYSFTKINDLR